MKQQKTIAIHQPNFLPWLGYFYKIAQSDIFVLYGEAQFSKGSITKRVKIHSRDLSKPFEYLTVATVQHEIGTPINELFLDPNSNWQEKIANKLHETYKNAPCYSQVEEFVTDLLGNNLADTSFSMMTESIIVYISERLGLETDFVLSRTLETNGSSTEALISYVKQLVGTCYYSGNGARKYLEVKQFPENDIDLVFTDFKEQFERSNFPADIYDKSIISYIANYSYEEIGAFLMLDN